MIFLILLPLVLSQDHTPHGSKTPYHMVSGDILDFEFPCKPVSLFSVHRHGTRNIGKKVVKRIDLLVNSLKKEYMKNGLPITSLGWILDFAHQHQPNKDLVVEGYIQLLEQGQRFAKAFPELFSNHDNVQVATSYKGRCISSALSFLQGAYGGKIRVSNTSQIQQTEDIKRHCEDMCHVYDPIINGKEEHRIIQFEHQQNDLLRYYNDCKNYVTKNNDKSTWQAIPNRYLFSKPMTKLTKKMSKRLEAEMSPHDVVTLHILCSLEVAMPRFVSNSHWCSIFKDKELFTTAFYLDLMRYESKMMPEAVNSSCVLFQDGLKFLETSRGASLKFAHTETIFPLLEHIRYLTEPMEMTRGALNRQFWGDITPLGGNFFLVAMECPGSSERTLQAFLNEKPIEFPGCGVPCKLEKVREMFPEQECDFEEICEKVKIDFKKFMTADMILAAIACIIAIHIIFQYMFT